jgi:transcriptional regulator with XRE-family HTH domain
MTIFEGHYAEGTSLHSFSDPFARLDGAFPESTDVARRAAGIWTTSGSSSTAEPLAARRFIMERLIEESTADDMLSRWWQNPEMRVSVVLVVSDLAAPAGGPHGTADEGTETEGASDIKPDEVLARRVEEACEVLGTTREQLAGAVGLSRATIFAWMNGSTRPRPSTRRALDRLLGLTGSMVRALGLSSARSWFAMGSPSRAALLLAGELDSVAEEVTALVVRPALSERTRRRDRDEEPGDPDQE